MKDRAEKRDKMTELVTKAETTINEMAAILADFPAPQDWTHEQKEQAVKFAALFETAQTLIGKKAIAGIDYQAERETFLSYTTSAHTRRAYSASLDRLDTWTQRKGYNPLELTAAQADSFCHDMKADGRAAASVRRDIAAVSAFYTHLERSTDAKVRNPIRGTRQRPRKTAAKETIIPTAAEMETILDALPPIERAIIATLAGRGLRAGALPTLTLKGGKYHGMSKGKRLTEGGTDGITLPQEALDAIAAAGLDVKRPFAWTTKRGTTMSAGAVENRINTHMSRLYREGKIRAAYSAHDFRHFFAVREYERTRDIYRVSMLLGHANIAITQTYLKSLAVKL